MNNGAPARGDTFNQILDVAERLAQVRGFNAFSYADVAAELQITSAALHYHFASKSDLGEALIVRYATRFAEALSGIERGIPSAPDRLDAYAELYAGVLAEERMCLCGVLAAEYSTLPEPMRQAVVSFFSENETWLTRVLSVGADEHTLEFDGPADEVARTIVSTLEGAMLIARPYGELRRFEEVARHLLAGLRPSRRSPAPADDRGRGNGPSSRGRQPSPASAARNSAKR